MNQCQQEIIKKEEAIKNVVIKRNPYHQNFFTKKITYTDGMKCSCGGYKTMIEEIVAITNPDLDRFTDKIKDRLMEYIYQDIKLLNNQLKMCMEHIHTTSDKYHGKYNENEILKILNDE